MNIFKIIKQYCQESISRMKRADILDEERLGIERDTYAAIRVQVANQCPPPGVIRNNRIFIVASNVLPNVIFYHDNEGTIDYHKSVKTAILLAKELCNQLDNESNINS